MFINLRKVNKVWNLLKYFIKFRKFFIYERFVNLRKINKLQNLLKSFIKVRDIQKKNEEIILNLHKIHKFV